MKGRAARKKTSSTFVDRRARFFDGIREGVALLFTTPEASFGHDVAYRYRPDPDFYYLTGFREPGAVAVLDAGRKTFVLFVRPKDRERETWEGRRAGPLGAVADFSADAAYPIGELRERLPDLLRGASVLHHALGIDPEADRLVGEILARFRKDSRNPLRGPVVVSDPTKVLHEMRLIKGPDEIALLERSCAIAARAHREAMAAVRAGLFEYELESLLERRFKAAGADGASYPTIVASGANATILHYIENRRRLRDGDLVLVDAGCDFQGYASDITRTYPVSGRFTRAQARLYAVVLAAQEAALDAVKPGAPFQSVHEAAREALIEGCLSLGLLRGTVRTIRKKGSDSRFFLHRTSHWLGLDVHDRGRYVEGSGASRTLEPGMVLTVEPGLYVRPDEEGVPEELRGMGIRIEDDVLVTEQGSQVLTAAAPKTIDEIYGTRGRNRQSSLLSPTPIPRR